MKIEVPFSEVLDRMSILEIKIARVQDHKKRANVRLRLEALLGAWNGRPLPEEYASLKQVNERLWDVEDALRAHEQQGDFGERFVTLARSVYHLNDERARVKRTIDDRLGSRLVEEKSYGP